jgi:hypothetical protein
MGGPNSPVSFLSRPTSLYGFDNPPSSFRRKSSLLRGAPLRRNGPAIFQECVRLFQLTYFVIQLDQNLINSHIFSPVNRSR